MKKFFTVLFVSMGVLFLLQLIALAYLFVVDPYNLKPILFPADRAVSTTPSSSVSESGDEGASNNEESATEASGMTAAQAEALSSIPYEGVYSLRAYPQTPATLLLPSLKHSPYIKYASCFHSVAPRSWGLWIGSGL